MRKRERRKGKEYELGQQWAVPAGTEMRWKSRFNTGAGKSGMSEQKVMNVKE